MLDVATKAALFAPITLAEMDSVKLMNRTDAKFMVPLALLPDLLDELLPHYRLLDIDGYRRCPYQTLYFDTPDLRLYHEHLGGRLNRYKIRQRSYVQSALTFTEVKLKTNKGRTIKTRIRNDGATLLRTRLDQRSTRFVAEQTPINPADLRPVLWVNYDRMTLVSRTTAERLTLDLNMTFRRGMHERSYPQVVIAEVKQESLRHSLFMDLMKRHRLREGGLSKYCLGILSLYPTVRQNRFKPKFNQFQKLMTAYAAATGAYQPRYR